MKKAIASVTVLIYFVLSCGVIVNMHYCMNRLQSVDLYVSSDKECSKCGMPMNKKHGCCRDEIKIIKLQNDQNKAQVFYSIQHVDVAINTPSTFIAAATYSADRLLNNTDHSPPLLTGQGIYLQNCVFRI